jgi:hypothetical protein
MSIGTGMQEERVRKVVIRLDNNRRPQLDEQDECIVLDRAKNEAILWISSAPFHIDFHGDSPFYENQFDNTHPHSGLARRNILGSTVRTYKYSIEINGQILDPGVKIDP